MTEQDLLVHNLKAEIKRLNALLSNEWILVSDLLPADDEEVSVTDIYGYLHLGVFRDSSGEENTWENIDMVLKDDEVLAWLPSPKKYEPEEKSASNKTVMEEFLEVD